MYQLYISEENLELKIKPMQAKFKNMTKLMTSLKDTPCDVYYYNVNYRFCGKRAPLVELARDIKSGWLVQAKNRVQKIEEIKI